MTSGTRHELSERAAWDARRNADAAERQANPEEDKSPNKESQCQEDTTTRPLK